MKNARFVLALLFATSFTMADTPTDAPLLPENPSSAAVPRTKDGLRATKGQSKKNACPQADAGPKMPGNFAAPEKHGAPDRASVAPGL